MDAAEASRDEGRVVDGKYRLLSQLGSGGMGAVFLAEHTFTGRRVALKLMHPELAASRVAAERFVREARAPGKIGHRGIVEVLDGGRDGEGVLYLALELLSGQTLADLMQGGPLPPPTVVGIVVALLDALSAAHGAGFVHRDVKPDNIFLTAPVGPPAARPERRETPETTVVQGQTIAAERVKLLDFGVAASLRHSDPRLTRTGSVLGTPLYMSPEQAKGQPVDARTDLWAVGALMYACLSGRPPFTGDTYNALIVSIATRQHVPLSRLRPSLPKSLLSVIERALQKDPDARWPSAEAMANALKACDGVVAADAGPTGAGAAAGPHTAQPPGRPASPEGLKAPPGVPRQAVWAATAMLVAVAGAAVVYLDGQRPEPADSAREPSPPAGAEPLGAEPSVPVDTPPPPHAPAPPPTPGVNRAALDRQPAATAGRAEPAAAQVPASTLAAAIANHRPALQRCYQTELSHQLRTTGAGEAPVALAVDVVLAVDGGGRVTEVVLHMPPRPGPTSTASLQTIQACLRAALRRVQFPPAGPESPGGGKRRAAFPIVFQPQVL